MFGCAVATSIARIAAPAGKPRIGKGEGGDTFGWRGVGGNERVQAPFGASKVSEPELHGAARRGGEALN
jgi:hypothetical protein